MFKVTRLLVLLVLFAGLAGQRAMAADATHYSPRFRIAGDVKTVQTYTVDMLKQLPPTKLDVFFSTGSGPVSASFTGVLLWDLLNTVGVVTDPSVKNDILHKEIIATGSDGYRVVFSMGELDPHFGGQPIIVAYLQDGQPLGDNTGATRLVVPGDKAGGRYVSWLVELNVGGPR